MELKKALFLLLCGAVSVRFLSGFLSKEESTIKPVPRPVPFLDPERHSDPGPTNMSSSRRRPYRSKSDIPFSRTTFLNEQQYTALDRLAVCSAGKQNASLVFIKTHKTGSTTLTHIINRFGYTRGLSFVISKANKHNGHLRYIPLTQNSARKLFLPPVGCKNGSAYTQFKYNLMNIHARFNRTVMDSFMASPTRYVTILRDPGYQFESAFAHFGFHRALLPDDKKKYNTTVARLARFLEKGEFYWKRMGPRSNARHYAKNNQMFDLGLDHDYHGNRDAVSAYIQKLTAELDLVLITEYFDESLVLLKKLLCWDWADIVYVSKNVRPPTSIPISESLRNKMREWNSADMQLYTHFNQSLWQKIERYGPTFQSDLETFRRELNLTSIRCSTGLETVREYRHFVLKHHLREGAGVNCTLIAGSHLALFHSIWVKQVPTICTVQ